MQQHGLRSDQVAQVRGFADQQPRNAKDPSDPANRRISILVQYAEQKTPEGEKDIPPPATAGGADRTTSNPQPEAKK